MTADQLVAKQRYETNLQENIQGLLDAAIGPKRSAVRVATDMDFDAGQTETESYAPQGTVRSTQTERESYQGTGSAAHAAYRRARHDHQHGSDLSGRAAEPGQQQVHKVEVDDELRDHQDDRQAYRRAR